MGNSEHKNEPSEVEWLIDPSKERLVFICTGKVRGLALHYQVVAVWPRKVSFTTSVNIMDEHRFSGAKRLEDILKERLIKLWREHWAMAVIGGEVPDWWLSTTEVLVYGTIKEEWLGLDLNIEQDTSGETNDTA